MYSTQAPQRLAPSYSYATVITAPLPKNRPAPLQQNVWTQNYAREYQPQQWARPGAYSPQTSYAKVVSTTTPTHMTPYPGRQTTSGNNSNSNNRLRMKDPSQYFNTLRGALMHSPEKYAEWEAEFVRQNRAFLSYLDQRHANATPSYANTQSWRRNPHDRVLLMLLTSLESIVRSMPPGLRNKTNPDTCQYIVESLECERRGLGDRPWLASMERWVDAL